MKPSCCYIRPWLRSRFPEESKLLAAMTGQDQAALEAFVHLAALHALADQEGKREAEMALAAVLRAAQPKVRPLFRFALARETPDDSTALWEQIQPTGLRFDTFKIYV